MTTSSYESLSHSKWDCKYPVQQFPLMPQQSYVTMGANSSRGVSAPPFVSLDVSLVIGRDRLSCGTQTSVITET